MLGMERSEVERKERTISVRSNRQQPSTSCSASRPAVMKCFLVGSSSATEPCAVASVLWDAPPVVSPRDVLRS